MADVVSIKTITYDRYLFYTAKSQRKSKTVSIITFLTRRNRKSVSV